MRFCKHESKFSSSTYFFLEGAEGVHAEFILFLFGVSRDNLQWIIWYCLLLLFYFVGAVEDVFARPNNLIVVSGLIIIVLLFSVCTAYIRFRGRERRTAQVMEE